MIDLVAAALRIVFVYDETVGFEEVYQVAIALSAALFGTAIALLTLV